MMVTLTRLVRVMVLGSIVLVHHKYLSRLLLDSNRYLPY